MSSLPIYLEKCTVGQVLEELTTYHRAELEYRSEVKAYACTLYSEPGLDQVAFTKMALTIVEAFYLARLAYEEWDGQRDNL
jgi:hypothetical protein